MKTIKYEIKLESQGTLDELNSWLGLLRSSLGDDYDSEILSIQSCIFLISSNDITDDHVLKLEKLLIDKKGNYTVSKFIIPGFDQNTSYCHIARTVCRRAERRLIELSEIEIVSENVLKYINILSNYLFYLAVEIERNF